MRSWLQVRERVGQVLGRPVPSHENIQGTLLNLADRVEFAEAQLAALPQVLRDHPWHPVFGCECTPEDEESGVKGILGGSWEAHIVAETASAARRALS